VHIAQDMYSGVCTRQSQDYKERKAALVKKAKEKCGVKAKTEKSVMATLKNWSDKLEQGDTLKGQGPIPAVPNPLSSSNA